MIQSHKMLWKCALRFISSQYTYKIKTNYCDNVIIFNIKLIYML